MRTSMFPEQIPLSLGGGDDESCANASYDVEHLRRPGAILEAAWVLHIDKREGRFTTILRVNVTIADHDVHGDSDVLFALSTYNRDQ